MTSQSREQEMAPQTGSDLVSSKDTAVKKSLIAEMKEDYLKYKAIIDVQVPQLIQQGKEMTALLMLTQAGNKIFEMHDSLNSFYSLILTNLEVLRKYESERLRQIGHDPLPTYDYLKIKEKNSGMSDSSNYTRTIVNFRSENLLKEHWYLPELIVTELEYMLDVMEILVEPEFVPFDNLDESRGGTDPKEDSRHIPAAVKLAVWRRDMGKCSTCNSRERLEYDHIIPVAKGGSNTERNVQLLCEKCNREKSARIA